VDSQDDRLNGWKEIAAFLGKGVRTVQRWESEYGLPVHRVGRSGGEIIWASRLELTEWLKTGGAEQRPPDSMLSATVSKQTPEVQKRRMTIVLGLGAFALMLMAAAFFRDATLPPVTWEVKGGHFTTFNRTGEIVFDKEFPFIDPNRYPDLTGRPGAQVVFRDLDSDGSTETILAAAAADFQSWGGLYVFNDDGSERFVVRPERRMTFGSGTYAGPWHPLRVLVTGEGKDLSILAAFIGPLEYPTLLLDLDSSGKVRAEYWSNGYIQALVRAPWKGKNALFVGATHNDSRGASLAIFEDGIARGAAPASNSDYRCMTCPDGRPSHFLVFPRRALAKAYPGGTGQSTVQEITIEGDDKIRVNVGEGKVSPGAVFRSSVWYTLTATFDPIEALLTSGYFQAHAQSFQDGELDRPFGQQDEADVFPVRRWNWDAERFDDLRPGRIIR
jgi:hypothetical protein